MKLRAKVSLIFLMLFAHKVWADQKMLCEVEMLPAVKKVLRLIQLGVESQDLTPRDLEFMLSDSERLQNPYRQKNRNIKSLTYRQILDRDVPKLSPQEQMQARAALAQLIGQTAALHAVVKDARHETRLVFAPKELRLKRRVNFLTGEHEEWIKLHNGKMRFGYWDTDKNQLMTLDPNTREISGPHAYRLKSEDVKVDSRFENNFAVILIRRASDSIISIEGFADQKTGVTEELPIDLEKVHLVRAPDKKLFAVAHSKKALIVYAVDEKLKLSQIRKIAIKSDSYRVINSEDGRVIVVTLRVANNEINILDPLSDENTRTFKVGATIAQVSPVLAPDGRYAVAIKVRKSKDGDQSEILVATSEKRELLRTETLNNAALVEWFIDHEKRVFLLVKSEFRDVFAHGPGAGRRITQFDVELFEPFATNLGTTEGPRPFWERFFKPQHQFKSTYMIRSGSMTGYPSLYESRDGRLFLLIGEKHWPAKYNVEIFEPKVARTASVKSFAVDASAGLVVHVRMLESDEGDTPYFLVNGSNHLKVFAGWENPTEVMSLPDVIVVNPPVRDQDGQTYLVGESPKDQNNGNTSELKLIKIISNSENLR